MCSSDLQIDNRLAQTSHVGGTQQHSSARNQGHAVPEPDALDLFRADKSVIPCRRMVADGLHGSSHGDLFRITDDRQPIKRRRKGLAYRLDNPFLIGLDPDDLVDDRGAVQCDSHECLVSEPR